jgi:hypothetical protein
MTTNSAMSRARERAVQCALELTFLCVAIGAPAAAEEPPPDPARAADGELSVDFGWDHGITYA